MDLDLKVNTNTALDTGKASPNSKMGQNTKGGSIATNFMVPER